MSATTHPSTIPADRGELRLRLVGQAGRHRLDGGWWPYSRDLATELRQLVDGFPTDRGRIARAVFSRPDWETSPRKVDLQSRFMKVGSFPADDTHVLIVQTASGERLTLLVIPPSFTDPQGAEALLAAATPGNAHSGTEVLAEVTNNHDADPDDRWAAYGSVASGDQDRG